MANISKIKTPDGTTYNVKDSVSGYTTNTGTITGITMNGSSKGTSGVVDLGTVLTAHQTIKQDGVTGATVNRFGTCSTAAATAAKTVSITTGTFALEAGATIAVKFTNANTANSPTLAVNSTAAKNIFVNGAQITSGGNKALLKGTVVFIYDGTQWNLIGNYYDTNSGGTVTQVKVGSTPYNPSSGVVTLPAYPTTLPASDTVHTYNSTSEAPISGKGVADAFATLPSPTGGTVTSVTIKGTSPIVSSDESEITISGTRTISHANSGVTAGTYKSVTVNATGHVTAGTNPTTLSGYGITDAKIASGTITLGSNTITPLTSSSTLDATKLSGTIPTSCYTDTKNTAGSTDTSSKIFLIGATSQAVNPQTYSQDTAYVGTDGCLYSGGTKVLTSHQDISGKLNKSGGEITGTVYSKTNGANFEVYSPSLEHKMRFTATDTPRSGLYDMIDSRWAFWKNQEGEYQIGPNGYAVQARTQAKGTTKYPLRDGVVFAFRSGASSNTITVACVSQWEGDSVVYQHHVSTINVTIDVWHETIKVANNTNGNIQVIMIGQFNDNSMF